MRKSLVVMVAGAMVAVSCSGSDSTDVFGEQTPDTSSTDDSSPDSSPDVSSSDSSPDPSAEPPVADGTAGTVTEGTTPDGTVTDNTVTDNTVTDDTVTDDTVTDDTEPVDAGDALRWALCPDSSNPLVQTECADLSVPLDYDAPDESGGERIEIAVARIDSASDDDQIGSLVFNPGGPGGSGIEFLVQAAVIIPEEVQQRFDLVSFDPRGVGGSTPLQCDIEIDDNITLVDEGDDEAYQQLVDETLADLDTCTPATSDLAPYVGTNNAARDLDALRAALGDDGLTYVGYSYGTRLGATYAELFPSNVRALVLDAAVKPTTDFAELDLGQAGGFDLALTNFAEACDADDDCLLQEVGPTLDVLDGLRTEIEEVGSFDTDDPDRILTPGELDLGVIAAMYSKDSWPFLAEALYLAETEQDGTLLQVLGDSLVGRQPDGTYDNSQVANTFINCADNPVRLDVEQVRADAEAAADQTLLFDDAFRASTGCLGIAEPLDPLIVGPAEGAPPILVIGNTGDPATPYQWSVDLAESLESGVLYTVEAEGHTAYGTIECVEEVVNAYLIDLDVPDEGATCSDNADADFFVPAGETQVGAIIALFDCLRENGADVPELSTADILADPTGETLGEAFDPTDPEFQAALGQCGEEAQQLQDQL